MVYTVHDESAPHQPRLFFSASKKAIYVGCTCRKLRGGAYERIAEVKTTEDTWKAYVNEANHDNSRVPYVPTPGQAVLASGLPGLR